jgi:hypothetical protein
VNNQSSLLPKYSSRVDHGGYINRSKSTTHKFTLVAYIYIYIVCVCVFVNNLLHDGVETFAKCYLTVVGNFLMACLTGEVLKFLHTVS